MNELNCGQEEQYAGPEKKKSTSKIVKRTLVVAALALAVYVVYSVVYLFVSPDRNIQQSIWFPKMLRLSFNHRPRLKIGKSLVEVKHGNV